MIKVFKGEADEIAFYKLTVTRRTEELPDDVPQQLKDLVVTCTFFLLTLDELTDICYVAQLSIFIRGIDDNFSVLEEYFSLVSLHIKTRGSDVFDKEVSCLKNY